ncbi:hypothetical protein FRB94_002407 [Tulasnella sp. JGI-2019a]|nr:hypothetical protein FRB94_002407 [Tulasnella sp. JGI-2019a]KAG9036392.1 hypothetical protein FRB95_008933 [Tulasnella sp. JGI-2019a]
MADLSPANSGDRLTSTDGPTSPPPALIIVMGVSSCGKSTIGAALAKALNIPFYDGDDLHPKSNIEKMSKGIPLDDADREPWLALIRRTADRICQREEEEQNEGDPPPELKGVVIACSALKKHYREILRGEKPQSHRPPPPHNVPSDFSALTHQVGEDDRKDDIGKDNLKSESERKADDKEEFTKPAQKSLRTFFVFIKGSAELLEERMKARQGHFMKVGMLRSQLATLEDPTGEEGVVVVKLEDSMDEQVESAVKGLKAAGFHEHHTHFKAVAIAATVRAYASDVNA